MGRPNSLSPADAERALSGWRAHDSAHALHGFDREALAMHDAARALILDLLTRQTPGRDLYSACARLGGLLAEAGASPSLAAATIDGAAQALGELAMLLDPAGLAAARASVAEGYLAAALEAERRVARRAWEYPACATRVSRDTVAITVGFPDDEEAFSDWCARVALAVSRDAYRIAILSGAAAAKAELARALGLVGVTVTEPQSQTRAEPKRRWFSWAGGNVKGRRNDEG